MAVLDRDLGDPHRVQRAISGAVAKAFAREGATVFLSGRNGAPVEAVVAVGGVAETATVDALDETALCRSAWRTPRVDAPRDRERVMSLSP
jgi:NAD(P)-dependent dehydrogenase (short-subunit alcohol dehydrogenase family)